MTVTFRVSAFVCLVAAFIFQIGSEAQLAAGNHAEEEEKKLNVVFGNLSVKSNVTPSDDEVTTIAKLEEESSNDDELSLTDLQRSAWKSDTNLTDFDDLHKDVNKNDASPENSVDRDSLDENGVYHVEDSKDETASVAANEKESTVEYEDSLNGKTTVPYDDGTDDTDDDAVVFSNSSCADNDVECKNKRRMENIASPRVDDKMSVTPPSGMSFSASSPMWNIVKFPRRQDATNYTSSLFATPFKSIFDEENFTSSTTEGSTTAQTSDNLIPVEGLAINKLDTNNDPLSDKTEKSKPTKHTSTSTTSTDRPFRTFAKPITTTPMTSVAKVNTSDDNVSTTSDDSPSTTILMTKIFPLISTRTPILIESSDILNATTFDTLSSEPPFLSSAKYDVREDAISPSPIPDHPETSPEFYSPFMSLLTTVSLYDPQNSVSGSGIISKEENGIKHDFEPTPRLLPSFRESSTVTERGSGGITISSPQVTSESSHAVSSSPHLHASTIQPQLNNGFIVKDSTPVVISDKEYVSPPRITNPGCSNLPACIEITFLDTTWDEFCPQAREFQDFVSKAVSHIIHPIHQHQVILEADNCLQGPPLYPIQATSDATVALFVIDDSGEYNEKLTEICALILRKWAPTTFRSSVMEVRLFSSELQATAIPVIPELNSGFVAAVSISAVAGVALCMLCILLVVMKQKLLQSRNSDSTSPAGDAYSLDSLSINASFRRRRNRKSARSYLNHAFSDQEIPSHPLNEKSLQGFLRNRDLLEEEFKKMPLNMPKLDQIPEGAHVKNRYSNILPIPETRVILSYPSGDPFECYINANYIKGYAGKPNTYIACQAPLPEGIEDFWRMVWEQQCRVIIMLTLFEENGIPRCATYFPQSTLVSNPPYGNFQVSLVKKDVYEYYTKSTFRVLDMEKNLFREVVHLWFTSWPDVGVPKDPSQLVYFVQQCRSFINCNAGPTVVHCSTGTGRTGVFLALDICTREYDESRSIDILQCVSQIRRARGGAVQNKDQYILIHEGMLEYISHMANQSQRSSIQST